MVVRKRMRTRIACRMRPMRVRKNRKTMITLKTMMDALRKARPGDIVDDVVVDKPSRAAVSLRAVRGLSARQSAEKGYKSPC